MGTAEKTFLMHPGLCEHKYDTELHLFLVKSRLRNKRDNMEPRDEQDLKIEEQEMNPEFNLAHDQNQLERGLKSRHIQFLALGMAPFSLSQAVLIVAPMTIN